MKRIRSRQAIAELRRARVLATVALGGLGEGEVGELIAARLSGTPMATIARSIVERTEGNPFFVEEFLRDVGSGATSRARADPDSR